MGFPAGSIVKNPAASEKMQEIRVRSLIQEDPLEKEMATQPGILAWEIPWTEELGRLQPIGSQRVRHDLVAIQQQQKRVHIKSSHHTQTSL